ncbi:hypothetical protein JCM6882_002660 [Rhodosporidiobolus microsporus]
MSTRASSSRTTRARGGQRGFGIGSGGADERREDEDQREEDWEGQRVAKHLDPLTLLHLSRSSKAFHQLFASRSAKGIWRAVRSSVDLPDLEADNLSEMAYVALMYDDTCNAPAATTASSTSSFASASVCLDYMGESYRPRTRLLPEPHPFLRDCMLLTRDGPQKGVTPARRVVGADGAECIAPEQWVFTLEVVALNEKLHDLQEQAGVPCGEFPASLEEAETWQRLRQVKVEEGGDEFKPEEKELALFDAQTLRQWQETTAARRRHVEQELLTQRSDAFNPFLDPVFGLVCQPEPLTDEAWSRISADILADVEANHNTRLAREAEFTI